MTFVFLGFVILIVSFLIALLTLIREQRGQEKEQESLNVLLPQAQEPQIRKVDTSSQESRVESLEENNRETSDSEPYPWPGKSQENDDTPSVDISSSNTSLLKGGEFIIPRSGDRK